MPGNAFIRFKEIDKGESTHETHNGKKGWFEISDWSWDIEADTSFLKGAGASVGKPQPGSLSFSHYYDMAAPKVMMRIVQGTFFSEVHLAMLKQTGDESGKGEVFFGATMTEAFITKVSSKGAEDGSVTQDVELVFKTIAIGYKPQSDDKKGDFGDQEHFTWDIGKMKTDVPQCSFEGMHK
jgi:type VI secretion system secreted protein Hcp